MLVCLRACFRACPYVPVCMCVCVRACMRACMRACVSAFRHTSLYEAVRPSVPHFMSAVIVHAVECSVSQVDIYLNYFTLISFSIVSSIKENRFFTVNQHIKCMSEFFRI